MIEVQFKKLICVYITCIVNHYDLIMFYSHHTCWQSNWYTVGRGLWEAELDGCDDEDGPDVDDPSGWVRSVANIPAHPGSWSYARRRSCPSFKKRIGYTHNNSPIMRRCSLTTSLNKVSSKFWQNKTLMFYGLDFWPQGQAVPFHQQVGGCSPCQHSRLPKQSQHLVASCDT